MTLTTTQANALKTAILADPALTAMVAGNEYGNIAAYYEQPANPAYIVWRTDVRSDEIGNAWVGTDIDGMSALNMQRLQLMLASSPSGVFDMSRADRRAGFENPFGTNASNQSRVAMRAVWKRSANRVERLFAQGTGSDASPGVLTFQGVVTHVEIAQVLSQ